MVIEKPPLHHPPEEAPAILLAQSQRERPTARPSADHPEVAGEREQRLHLLQKPVPFLLGEGIKRQVEHQLDGRVVRRRARSRARRAIDDLFHFDAEGLGHVFEGIAPDALPAGLDVLDGLLRATDPAFQPFLGPAPFVAQLADSARVGVNKYLVHGGDGFVGGGDVRHLTIPFTTRCEADCEAGMVGLLDEVEVILRRPLSQGKEKPPPGGAQRGNSHRSAARSRARLNKGGSDMAWTTFALRQLICDGCGEPGPTAPSRIDAALEAVAVGWGYKGTPLRRDSDWRCPDCKAVPTTNGAVDVDG
jgi:hypothetical protein